MGPSSSHALPCLMNRVYTLLHCCTLSIPCCIAIPCLYPTTTLLYPVSGSYLVHTLAPFAASLLPFTQIPPTQSLVIWWTDVLIPDHHHCHHAEGDGGGGGGGSSSRSSISLSSSSLTSLYRHHYDDCLCPSSVLLTRILPPNHWFRHLTLL